jgi:N-acetylglucosamine kinase-like BadF-type ATPase
VTTRILAIDGGRSGCRVRRREGGVVTASDGPPLPYLRGDDADEDLDAAIAVALDDLPSAEVDVVVAGLAGLFERPAVAPPLAARLAARTGAARVIVTGDLVTSYAGALGISSDPTRLRPGVVVAAGTGAVAFAVAADGRTARADGWGYLLGDEGSGYWIGRRGLAAALAHRDGRGGSAALRVAAEARFGRVETLPEVVHGSDAPAGRIAAFARDVAAAATAGDPVAAAIWTEAGGRLAASAAAAAAVHEGRPTPVSVTGGLVAAGPLLLEPFRLALARLAPHLTVEAPRGTALDGAEALASLDRLPDGCGHVRDAAVDGRR